MQPDLDGDFFWGGKMAIVHFFNDFFFLNEHFKNLQKFQNRLRKMVWQESVWD